MSVLDAFFSKGFKGVRCKTLLKLTIPRIKLLRNRREIQLKQMRRDIAKLLENGQEATARIRVEHIIREENMMAAQEIIELFCELIAVRLPIIETQRECPLDLKEAISSICFAAPRCADLPELQQVQMLFVGKYGKEFVSAATELRPDCGVNRQIIELLSIRAPPVEVKLKLLKEIAEEHEIDWDPTASETEYLKPHEDLLNGPSDFISGSMLPLPKEKHDESLYSTYVEDSHTTPDLDVDSGVDFLDLPEVPKASVRPNLGNVSAPEPVLPTPSSPPDLKFDHEYTKSAPSNEDPEVPTPEPLVPPRHSPPIPGIGVEATKQFVTSLPPETSFPAKNTKSTHSNEDVFHKPYLEPEMAPPPESLVPPQHSPPSIGSVEETRRVAPFVSPPPSATSFPARPPQHIPSFSESAPSFSESAPSLARTRSEAHVDLQDVLAAAQAAAESAERAAAAARSAASLAQIRITDLVNRRNGRDSGWNQQEAEDSTRSGVEKEPRFDQQRPFSHTTDNLEFESPSTMDHQTAPQPQRSTSLEDDPYFSYPNLFARQDSNLRSGHSSTDKL